MANKNEEQLKTMMSGQKTIDVKFKEDGKKHTTKLKVQDPGTSVGLDILDLTDVGDQTNNLPEAYDLVMRSVIISPKMSYESLNKELPDKFQKKDITKTNSDGDKVTITMKFPDYRNALGIIFEIQKNNGGMNNKKVMTDICNNVIVDKDNKHVDLDFFDEGSDGAGLTFPVMSEVMEFLSAPVNYTCIALFNFLLSIYGLCHLNYLDDPRITPFHVNDAFSLIAGMTDDLWLNLLLMLVSISLFIAIIANKHKWASAVFIVSIFIIMVCLAFSVRALEQHDNITWIVSLILIAIHTPREDGGIK